MDDVREADCWFCTDELRTDPPPGGWLHEDGTWRVGHAPAAYAIAGTVILEARRHVRDQAGMNHHEGVTLTALMGRTLTAIERVTGCDRVYQWATMDGYPHFHVWLLPWWESGPARGPRHLVAATFESGGCTPREAEEMSARLRDALARPVEAGAPA